MRLFKIKYYLCNELLEAMEKHSRLKLFARFYVITYCLFAIS